MVITAQTPHLHNITSFRIKVAKHLKSTKRHQTNIVMTVALYHGSTELCTPFATSTKAMAEEIHWNERASFPIHRKDLPKVNKQLHKCYSWTQLCTHLVLTSLQDSYCEYC